MASLRREEGMALMMSLTAAEAEYLRRRMPEVFEAGGSLGDMARIPLEEIAAARAKEVRQ